MANNFREGFEFFQKNAGALFGSEISAEFGTNTVNYVEELTLLENSINDFEGYQTPSAQLKGDIAEFWHAGTFNTNAALNDSLNRAVVNRSNEYASVDISLESGESYSLKYYASGVDSAKQQAVSVFQRFKEYQGHGGKDSFDQFLSKRNYSDESVLNDPIYSGQYRVIPRDQMEEATKWLSQKIAKESVTRPDQVKRFQDTLDMLKDKLSDSNGNESIPLSQEEAQRLAESAEKGEFKAEDFGLTSQEEMIVKEALKDGLTAAAISMILKVAPEIYKAIDYLIKNGEVDAEQFKRIGIAAVSGAGEGFIRGTVAAAISYCCKSGMFGEGMKKVDSGVIGVVVALTMNTMKNAFMVAIGKKTRNELSYELIRDMFVAGGALAGSHLGKVGGAIIGGVVKKHIKGPVGKAMEKALAVAGSLLGSFVGSVAGTFVFNTFYKTAITFCIDTGVTLFGIVDQDYKLPEDIIKEIGLETFDFDTFQTESFEPESFSFDTFEAESIQPDTLGITMLRRGVIGVSRVGYVTG
ncbi:MAG TPA: hypothetical protein GXZ43_06175 [Clostridiaceae bacterium]|nr:hypothetical protein [Clostridiaceae bacterium]